MGSALKHTDITNVEDRIAIRLLESHTHFFSGPVTEENVMNAIKWVKYENLQKPTPKLLKLYVNSYGGDLYQSMALVDIMKASTIPISTIGIGNVMSAAFLIFVSGATGHRYISKNAGIMMHQHIDELTGKYDDLKSQISESKRCDYRMLDILTDASKLDEQIIREKFMSKTDLYFSSQELVSFGMADHSF